MNCARPINAPQPGVRTILVTEEQILVRMAIADEIRKQGFVVAEAANTHEALSILHSGISIDLIMTNMSRPQSEDQSNLTAIIQMEYPEVKVVVASAQMTEDQLGLEVDGFVRKPYDAPEVAVWIKALLDQ